MGCTVLVLGRWILLLTKLVPMPVGMAWKGIWAWSEGRSVGDPVRSVVISYYGAVNSRSPDKLTTSYRGDVTLA